MLEKHGIVLAFSDDTAGADPSLHSGDDQISGWVMLQPLLRGLRACGRRLLLANPREMGHYDA